jgi:hypothetical protein
MLTREQIEKAEGRELDALVAEHVMGWKSVWSDGKHWMAYPPHEKGSEAERHPIWPYSTDHNAAFFEVVWKMIGQSFDFKLRETKFHLSAMFGDTAISAKDGETRNELICKCALLALLAIQGDKTE